MSGLVAFSTKFFSVFVGKIRGNHTKVQEDDKGKKDKNIAWIAKAASHKLPEKSSLNVSFVDFRVGVGDTASFEKKWISL